MFRPLRAALLLIPILTLLGVSIVASQGNEAALLTLINNYRAQRGVQQLTSHESLRIAAVEQARWMTASGQIAHSHNGSTHRSRALAAGYGSTWVAEIIFMSPNTSHVTAWDWWLQSPIHHNTIVAPYYENAGVGRHTANGRTAYVVVFGNLSGNVPAGPANDPPATGNDANRNDAVPRSPAGLVGQDEQGYILHRIQPGETLGDLALIYGYNTWDVVTTMEAVNQVNRYALEVGQIIRVPPYDGTWTPTPARPIATATPESSPASEVGPSETAPPTTTALRATVTPAASSTPRPTVWLGEPQVLPIPSATPPPPLSAALRARNRERRSIIIGLIIALGLQGALLLGIGAIYLRQRASK
ncbi:MAG: CAP domain-containing protein [Anaerolineaceae bacterium]|nr:CAP domain-containing protein [Anaerolineaceae bacterium]